MGFVFDKVNSKEFIGGELEVICLEDGCILRVKIKAFDFECFSNNTIGIQTQWSAISTDQGDSYVIHMNVEELHDYNHEDFEIMESK